MTTKDTRPDSPSAVAEQLRANPKLLKDDANYKQLSPNVRSGTSYVVRLTIENGYFQLNWSATTIGSYDWVGLYVNQDMLDSDYIGGNNWQWGVRSTPYTTTTPAQSGFQARYLIWDAQAGAYKAVAKTDPWSVED